MTKEELDAFLASEEARRGLMTGELRSIWQQESGGSLDPTLKGQKLSRGRGNAIGPFQVVPYYHKDFPANGTIAEQAKFFVETYPKGGKTPEDRAAGWYGRGVAPKGHPTTAQYQQQIVSRLPQYEARPEPVAPPPSMPFRDLQSATQTQQEQTMAEPYNIMNAASPDTDEERKRREMMAFVQQQAAQRQANMPRYSDYQDEPMPQRELSMFDKMMSNPLTQMGAAMMVGSGVDWGRAGGMGLMAANNAVYNRQQAENELWELQQKRKEAAYKRGRDMRKDSMEDQSYEQRMQLADMYEAQGDIQTAMQLRGGTLKTQGEKNFSLTPKYISDGKGNIVEVTYDSQGGRHTRPLGKGEIPLNMSPEDQSRLAEAKAGGAKVGEANAATAINAPGVIQKADSSIALLDSMLSHPGLDKAVGWASVAPTFPESDAADYETKFKQLGGKNFLQAFESLKGGGQITEIEGQKATEAIAALSMKQSAKDHREALQYLRDLAVSAKQRAQAGYNTNNPYRGEGQAAPATAAPAGGVRKWNRELKRFE